MFSPSGEYSESRPFKIFISLLDKWEIGSPLTEVLVVDAFRALKQLLASGGADDVLHALTAPHFQDTKVSIFTDYDDSWYFI